MLAILGRLIGMLVGIAMVFFALVALIMSGHPWAGAPPYVEIGFLGVGGLLMFGLSVVSLIGIIRDRKANKESESP